MFTTIIFGENIDPAGVMVNLAAAADQHIKTSGDYVTISDLNNLVGAYACMGTAADEARLVSPSLRRTNPYYIAPVEGALAPSADPLMMYHPASPVPLDVNESLEAQCDSDPAAAEQLSIAAWLSDGPITPVTGEIFTVNAHITLALVLDSWEFSEITFPDSLPVADYDVVGARLVAANGVIFRFVPVGASNRPGGVSASTVSGKDPWCQRFGRMGVWCSFNTVQPPGVEVYCSAAAGSATYELYIDVIKRT